MEGHLAAVTCIEVDWTAMQAASGSQDGTVRLWSLETYSVLKLLPAHLNEIRCIQVRWPSQAQVATQAAASVPGAHLWSRGTAVPR
mmetsp:Transcript_71586/g.140568  ORF Transcript_71586/g.140568 Transcript_71586/m.140568 type:complete len:86 (-) Transcript_71586:18-275(-)